MPLLLPLLVLGVELLLLLPRPLLLLLLLAPVVELFLMVHGC